MSGKISVHGSAAQLVFSYTENDAYNTFPAPGGAALIAKLLSKHKLADKITPNKSMRKLHLELTKPIKNKGYTIARRLGTAENETQIKGESGAPYALLWGSNFDTLPVTGDTSVIWACHPYSALPDKKQFAQTAAQTLLLIDANVLRSKGDAMISRQISWERSAIELMWQLKNNEKLSYLLSAKEILVTFAEDGAVHITRENKELKTVLVLAHGGGEGTSRTAIPGYIDDAFAVMTAAAAIQFVRGESLRVMPILKTAENLLLNGYSLEQLKNSEYEIVESKDADVEFPIELKKEVNAPDTWCISNSISGMKIFDTAFNYVRHGRKEIKDLPKLSFRNLTTVDRWEIEAFQNVRNQIERYANSSEKKPKPLSIAVFGTPGSGKSFGVKQIALHVLNIDEKDSDNFLEFNVAQFTGFHDIGAAFQKVRDVILSGKLPLVFFDEFDADKDGMPKGWIKYFLMPMQDGKFKDESGEHPVGKCVLVFAGGTSSSFEDFVAPQVLESKKDLTDDEKKELIDFKNRKIPDFASRLKGNINILGPNQKDKDDNNYLVRRALLLRSLIERKMKIGKDAIAPISDNIIWAMLLVPKYKHGARSVEAIFDMSQIEDNIWEPVSLPLYSQLELHVDAKAFIDLVQREVILNSHLEELSIEIHEYYRKKYPGATYSIDWNDLPEEIRESNRVQYRQIPEYLSIIQCSYDSGDTPYPSVESFTAEETELLAEQAHIVWMKDKEANDWTYAPERNDELKHNPLMVSWDKLPDDEKVKDRDIIINLIPMLKKSGLRVYRTI